ncbi:MAG: hypothetical protein AAF600_12440, partial [Bacteroidota bacterium]
SDEIDDVVGFENGELHLMKKCVAGGSGLITTLGTLTSPPQLSLAIVGVLTFFTNEPIGPFKLSEVVIASLIIRKLLLELKEGEALVFFLHNFDR